MDTRRPDPVLVEVVNNELAAIAEEMAISIWRSGISPLLRAGDLATVICDGKGRAIGQGFGAPYQRAQLNELLPYIIETFAGEFQHGDVVVTNDPYAGMGHLPDVGVVVPVLWESETIAFCAAYSHHSDIGGRFPGGLSSFGKSIFEEGLVIPISKIHEAGKVNDELLKLILGNVRIPEEWMGDFDAKVSGCLKGAEEVISLLTRHTKDEVVSCCDYMMDKSEHNLQEALARIPDGEYLEEEEIEDGMLGDQAHLKLRLEVRGDSLTADFLGTSSQMSYAINAPITMTRAAVYGAVHAMVAPDELLNAGFVRRIDVEVPARSILNPSYPAPVAGRGPVFFRVFDMALRALAEAVPERAIVPGVAGDVIHVTGQGESGRSFAFLDTFFGGWGARAKDDGIDGVAPVFMGSYGTVPAELLERQYPVVVEGFGFVQDSEGAGKFRGSLSIFKQWRFLASSEVMVRTTRPRPSRGLMGGESGARARTILNPGTEGAREFDEGSHVHLEVQEGDRLYHSTGGCGGFGPARERDHKRIFQDVVDEKTSVERAERKYGLRIDAKTSRPDGPEHWASTSRDLDPAKQRAAPPRHEE